MSIEFKDQIILIGNSPSVLKTKLGEVIDSFGVVCRFNNFQIKGYEEEVGTKLDWFACRAADDVALPPLKEVEKVLCFISYCRYTAAMTRVANDIRGYYRERCEVVRPSVCAKLGAMLCVDQPRNQWPSIGIQAVALLAQRFNGIYIHGFSTEIVEGGFNDHYYPLKPKDACFHDARKEIEFINSLVRQGKVKRLPH